MSFSGEFIGANEAIRWLDEKDRGLSIIARAISAEAGRFMVNELKRNVHVWKPGKPRKKPHMRDVIKTESGSNDMAIVSVPTNYAQIENDRMGSKPGHGPHNFGDRAEQTTTSLFNTKIRVRYNDFFRL